MRKSHPAPEIADDDLVMVAAVAEREGWPDLENPPADHSGSPRTLAELEAVGRYTAHLVATNPDITRRRAIRLRLAVAAGTVVVLGACWYVSPARTAIALIGGGLFCLVALRRGRRRTRGSRRPAFGR
jgi:Flp pilus assembly protein TadB